MENKKLSERKNEEYRAEIGRALIACRALVNEFSPDSDVTDYRRYYSERAVRALQLVYDMLSN